ncbi:hypothetical protein C0J52_11717 [Blattella germanica]|nr:hypothetical protein C0J52_11717 [Blattella germanica]
MSSSGVKFSGVKIVPQIKHRDIFLETWNVRTLYSSGALEILTRELDRTGLDIVALHELRWPGEGSQESGKFTLYYGGATKPEFGTGFIVRRSILSAIKFVSDRISYIILKGKRHDFIIVNAYGPTEASDNTIKDKFYEELESLMTNEGNFEEIKITNRFETLECSEENVATEEETNINRERESIRDTIKLSASESVGLLNKRQSRKWFDDECADMINKRILAKMNWIREPNEQNSEQLCSIRRETTKFLKNKKREYLKEKINDLEINAKNRNIRELYQGIKIEREGFQARTNIIKDENGDMLADAKSILNRWGNYFNQLLNVHGEEEIEEHNVQTAEVEMAMEKLKIYKASGIDGIPAELIKSGGEKLREKIHRLLSLIWKQEALPNEWKESIIIPIYKKGDKTDCNNYRGISLLSTSYKILTNKLVSRLTLFIDKIIGDHQCGFRRNRSTIDQIFSIRQILEKKWEYNGTAYDSIKREKLCSILINFGITKTLVRFIGMCPNGTKIRVRVGKQVSDIFEIHNGLKQGDALP